MQHNLGGWVWLSLLIAIAIYETYASFVPGGQTMSEWVWWYSPQHWWFKYVFLTLVGYLMYHLFFSRH